MFRALEFRGCRVQGFGREGLGFGIVARVCQGSCFPCSGVCWRLRVLGLDDVRGSRILVGLRCVRGLGVQGSNSGLESEEPSATGGDSLLQLAHPLVGFTIL